MLLNIHCVLIVVIILILSRTMENIMVHLGVLYPKHVKYAIFMFSSILIYILNFVIIGGFRHELFLWQLSVQLL